jgi:hypothetical protein
MVPSPAARQSVHRGTELAPPSSGVKDFLFCRTAGDVTFFRVLEHHGYITTQVLV